MFMDCGMYCACTLQLMVEGRVSGDRTRVQQREERAFVFLLFLKVCSSDQSNIETELVVLRAGQMGEISGTIV